MIDAWQKGKSLRVVSDQIGCPTSTEDLARVLADLVERNAYPGVYHACGPTIANWHEFAVTAITCWKTATGSEQSISIEAIPTEAYPTPAQRPKYSVLACKKLEGLGIAPMRNLPEALTSFVGRLL